MRARVILPWLIAGLSLTAKCGGHAAGAPGLSIQQPVTSHSGRFVITTEPLVPTPESGRAADAALGLIELNPNRVAVSCEKVRDALNRALGVTQDSRRPTYVALAPAARVGRTPRVVSTRYRDAWQHHLTLPNPIDEPTFVRAVVNVLLLQLVDRQPSATAAEIPLWLETGLALHLQASNPDLLVRFDLRLNREQRLPDPLEKVRAALWNRPALSFEELSWPDAAGVARGGRSGFEPSAHLFVHQLLQLRDGRALCRQFVNGLSGRLNWQTSFLHTYGRHFDSLLAVEKWWAVHLVSFTGRDQWRQWPLDTALTRLEEAVRVDARQRADANSVPSPVTLSLQQVLREWTGQRQREVIQSAIQKLTRVRQSVPGPLLSVVDGYLELLDAASKRGPTVGYGLVATAPGPVIQPTVTYLVGRLDALDAERAGLRELSLKAARASSPP